MKKFVLILVILVLVLSLTACGEPKNTVYQALNSMLDADHSVVSLTVETTMYGAKLTNKFVAMNGANNTMVTYTVEELATFNQMPDSDNWVIPEEMIIEKSGSATIKNGEIVEQDGDAVNIPVNALEGLQIEFKKNYFSNATDSDTTFSATVVDIVGFTNNPNFDGKNMTVSVTFDDNINLLVLTYTTTAGANVVVTYSFS